MITPFKSCLYKGFTMQCYWHGSQLHWLFCLATSNSMLHTTTIDTKRQYGMLQECNKGGWGGGVPPGTNYAALGV